MKYLYISVFLSLSLTVSAQVQISFEPEEGYTAGSLHGQNGWEVTESSDGIVQHQTISNEQASEGAFSFKNGHEPDYDFQWFPIFGAAYAFETPLPADQEFTLSYSILVTGQQGADFEFVLYGVNESEEFTPVAGVGIENRGYIYLINDENYGFEYAEATWEPNQWIDVRAEVSSSEIAYFINNVLQNTIARFNDFEITGMNFLHNNYGHDAYYDNIQLSFGNMHTNEIALNETLRMYPNPVNDVLHINAENHEIKTVQIMDSTGKIAMSGLSATRMDVNRLSPGVYVLLAETKDGKKFSRKFIKK